MAELFEIVGEEFFKPFTSLFKRIYVDCLNIIYDDDEMLCCECETSNILYRSAPRPSDDLGAKTVEETVNLKVKWILE